eukprot:1664328-Pyramimonas_sp.AAC.1
MIDRLVLTGCSIYYCRREILAIVSFTHYLYCRMSSSAAAIGVGVVAAAASDSKGDGRIDAAVSDAT